MSRHYLDHNATTPVDPRVQEAMLPLFMEEFGNPSSGHAAGREAKKRMEAARAALAASLNVRPDEIVFTSGGTESDNLALFGVLTSPAARGRHLVTTRIEHSAVRRFAEMWETRGGAVTWIAAGDDGRVSAAEVLAAIQPDTALVSVMWANNETGVIQPVEEIAAGCRERGVPFHTDAVQAWGKIAVDVKALGCDLLSVSAHKVGGPKGVGALYKRKSLVLEPMMIGGRQEKGFRHGTESVPLIVGLGRAAQLVNERLASAQRLTAMRDAFEQDVLARVSGVHVLGREAPRVANTSNLTIAGVEGEAVAMGLDVAGYCVSTGSACSSGRMDVSAVALGMNISREEAKGAIRVSIACSTTEEELAGVANTLVELIPSLRG